MLGGAPELDIDAYRPWRFGAVYRDQRFAADTAREAYRYYYRLRYPHDVSQAGRGRRSSPLQVRTEELGAVFAAKNGWERPDYYDPGRPWRRAGEDQRAFGFSRPPYLDLLAAEHAAFRERVGIIDLSSFGKIDVCGPGALGLLERVCDNRIDRPVGRVIYTQFLNDRGGIVADLTVTRLGPDAFRIVTGAAAVDSDRGWLELHRDPADPPVQIPAPSWPGSPATTSVRRRCPSPPPARSGSVARPCSRSASPTSASWGTSCTSRPNGPSRCGTG
jgi:4-methylaminobutanoate oxidase (formaldehyde-forming)